MIITEGFVHFFNTCLVLFTLNFEGKYETDCKPGFSSRLVYSEKKLYFIDKKETTSRPQPH